MPKARAKCDPELTERFQAWWESRVTDHGEGVQINRLKCDAEIGMPGTRENCDTGLTLT